MNIARRRGGGGGNRMARGQMFVMLAILIPTLLGAVALGVDITIFYWNWARMQAAADAAVLAGGAYLPTSPAQAKAAATQYAQLNGMTAGETGAPVVAPDNLSISITLTRQVSYYFGRALGLGSSAVVVTATAGLLNTGSATGALPIGMAVQTTYAYGQAITLHQGQLGAPGNWDALALGCTGGACYSSNLSTGYSGTVSVGTTVQSEPGVKVGPTRTGINDRVSAGMSVDPGGTWNSHTLTDPRAVIAPVVDWTGCGGSCTVPVKGFAALWIVGVGSGGDINVIFIGSVASGTVPSPTAGSFGTYRVVLTQ